MIILYGRPTIEGPAGTLFRRGFLGSIARGHGGPGPLDPAQPVARPPTAVGDRDDLGAGFPEMEEERVGEASQDQAPVAPVHHPDRAALRRLPDGLKGRVECSETNSSPRPADLSLYESIASTTSASAAGRRFGALTGPRDGRADPSGLRPTAVHGCRCGPLRRSVGQVPGTRQPPTPDRPCPRRCRSALPRVGGARPVIGHILAGHFLRQSLPVGTSLTAEGRTGTVERVGAVDTLVRGGDGAWSIPNAMLLERTLDR